MSNQKQEFIKYKLEGHITTPGDMTIISSNNHLTFYTDLIEVKKTIDPGKVYNMNFGKYGIDLVPTNDLSLPNKIYDFEEDFRNQVLTTLRCPHGNMNIGVLLEGYKGQGKSVIAKQLAIESGLPIILINTQIYKDFNFTEFLNGIKQDYVLLIDEFEKLFLETDNPENKYHTQDIFLGFMDGTQGISHKRLILLTSNKEIGDKFINRPSRVRYYKKFNFMSRKVFNAIIEDKLNNQDFKQDLEENLDIPSCTIDILTTIIEEINIHNKAYSSFKEFFNHKDRDIIYSKYRQESDSTWKFIEDLSSKREIGVENENVQNIAGYHAKVIKNDGETIIYELNDYVDADNEDEKKSEECRKFIFKLIKQKSWKANTSLTF